MQKKRILPAVLTTILTLGLLAQFAAAQEPGLQETPEQRDARMQWWREARFCMFIHWGVYSVPSGTYKGERIQFKASELPNTTADPGVVRLERKQSAD